MDSGKEYTIDEACKLIENSLEKNTYKVNFTGGEPLVQHEAVMELAKFVREKGLTTYLESACYDSDRFAKLLPYIDICKVEFKMSDSEVVDMNHYDKLLQNEIRCLMASVSNRKITYIKIVVTNSTDIKEFAVLVGNIFQHVSTEDIDGFVIQPSDTIDKPTTERLLRFYDIVCSHYREVRIIPQLHKQMGAR